MRIGRESLRRTGPGTPRSSPAPPTVRPSLRRVVVGTAVLVAVLAACGDDGDDGEASVEPEVYGAIVRSVAGDLESEDDSPVVYIAPMGDAKPLPLDLQVGVLDSVGEEATVRFVDDFDEARDAHKDDESFFDRGVLLRLGPVSTSDSTFVVEGETYRTAIDGSAVAFTVTRQGDDWLVMEGRRRPLPTTTSVG